MTHRTRYLGEPTSTYRQQRTSEWVCACPGLRPRQRHKQEWECLPPEKARAEQALKWLAKEFGR